MKQYIDKLMRIAKRRMPLHKSFCDEVSNKELPLHSRLNWIESEPYYVEVYYTSMLQGLAILAHEIGHLMTLPELGGMEYYKSGPVQHYNSEVQASAWAIEYLLKQGLSNKEMYECVDVMQYGLDTHFMRDHGYDSSIAQVNLHHLKQEVEV